MLSEKSRPTIEATLPIIGERIGHITPRFYKRMFDAHPELLDGIFSTNNQKTGYQPKALAGSIAVFASHLVQNPGTLPEALLSRIAHKHTSLGILPEQYNIVYENLFAAIVEDLGDAITPEVAEAWTEVYWLMADALIKLERDLYAQQANNKIWAPWRVVSKTATTKHTHSFVLEPADDTPVTPSLPGQYVSVKVKLPSGIHQARQYTLTANGANERSFTTKRDDEGEVSPLLHNDIQVGDVVQVSNPYGDVVLDSGEHPVVFASAGIGCTPTAAMIRTLADSDSKRDVVVLHADHRPEEWALSEQIRSDLERLSNATLHTWLGEDTGEQSHSGHMSLSDITLPDDASVYICGPLPFMKKIREEALAAGIPAHRVHYEIFGPDVWQVS
ncbi:globin domain-containing protein [Lysinibacter sp. HNR]|uniref:globin domain-containing protein n=1 Tax=Lysinibacter sp. HNR TaxID=3031408 RepID=UPI002436133D|nr:globin domain-containing protein [Lysinibacter sp. HNR]WGD37741.1 FAD-binding oxidoreductase [Lysinibacter sp. HNR]